MDIHHLIYFIEVVRQESFTKASQVLHITQPTISKMVKNIEDELGVQLLERKGKSFSLTDAGKVVYQQARQIVQSFQNLSEELADLTQVRKGQIRIGIPPMVGSHFFPQVLAEFHAHYPDVHIRLIEVGGKKVEHLVEEGSMDLGVAVLPVNDTIFHTFSFVRRNLQLLVPAGHRLAQEKRVSLADLREEPFILFRDDFTLHGRIIKACQEKGFIPRIIFESNHWDFIGGMVAANLGVAFLPDTVCQRLDLKQIHLLTVDDLNLYWHLGMIWKKDKYLSFAAREWIRFTRRYMQQHRELFDVQEEEA